MTNDELYEIVKNHTDSWPEDVVVDKWPSGDIMFKLWGSSFPYAELAFEASFHRAIRKHTYCMRVEDHKEQIYVIVKHHQFEAPTLIEAYAKALEWLK